MIALLQRVSRTEAEVKVEGETLGAIPGTSARS
jgi:D-Tyr-tRNAtyr deacylase